MKKRIFGILLCLYMVAILLPQNVFAAGEVNTVILTIDEPAPGGRPAATASLSAGASTEVRKVEWEGDFDGNGCFLAGKAYTVRIHVYMKADMDKVFPANISKINAKINSGEKKATVERVTDTYLIVSVTYAVGGREAFPKVSNEELKPGDYGTALVDGTFVRAYGSMDKSGADVSFTAMKGEVVDLDAAYILGEGVWPNWHQISYGGKTGYLLVNNPANGYTCALTDFVVEGNRPTGTGKTEETVKETDVIAVSVFKAKPGKMPRLGGDDFKVGYSRSGCAVDSITYSPDAPCTPYTRVTATVTYKAKDGYIFGENCQSAGQVTKSMERIDEKTVVVTYVAYVGSDGTDRITRDMYDYGKGLEAGGLAGEYFPVVATGTMCATGSTKAGPDYEKYYVLKWPTMCSERVNGKTVSGRRRSVTKKINIIDLHAERRFADVVGNWYLVSCGNAVGFIPAAYVDDVEPTGYWDGAPGADHDSLYSFAGGTGTPEDPYLIATPEQLDAVRKGLTRSYKLIADIDLSDWGNWIPIGASPAYGGADNAQYADADKGTGTFTGTFDGNGHVISGMTIIDHRDDLYLVSPGADRVYSLFAKFNDQTVLRVGGERYEDKEEAMIKDLGIINYTIDISYQNISEDFTISVAPLFGTGVGTIENCYAAGGSIKVACGGKEGVIRVGGIGVIAANLLIKDCYNTSPITVTNLGGTVNIVEAGGIFTAVDYTWFVNCYNTGDITLPFGKSASRSSASGICNSIRVADNRGIIGTEPVISTVMYNCYNTGSLTASGAFGIAGYTPIECYVTNCYNVGKLTGDPEPKKNDTAEIMCSGSDVWKYGTKYVHDNGVKVVSGDMWKNSKKLGRKVLKSNPEDAIKLPAAKKLLSICDSKLSSIKKQTYTGKALTPAITVTYKGKKLVEGKDYTVGYSKNVLPGKAEVVVYGLGAYKGTVAKTFYITPAKMTGVTGSSGSAKTVTLKWTKDIKGNGYIIQYSTDKNFKEGVKEIMIESRYTATQKISGLTSGKTYYFRICSYKTEGMNGPYSKAVAVKVK